MVSGKTAIHFDFSMQSVIQSCFNYEISKIMLPVAGKLIQIVMSQPQSEYTRNVLAGLFLPIASLDSKIEEYSQFFWTSEFFENEDTITFLQKMEPCFEYQNLPGQGDIDLALTLCSKQLQAKHNEVFIGHNITHTNSVNLLSHIDASKPKKSKKDLMPISNVLIDLRYILLVPRIEEIIGRHDSVDSENSLGIHPDGVSEQQFAHFLELQNKMFGEDIDKQEEMKKFIDLLYFENLYLIKFQFYIFMGGFMLPFFA